MLATLESSPLQASRWSFFTRSASPVVEECRGQSHGLVTRCRSASAVGTKRTVHTLRKRTASEIDAQVAAPRTRQRTTWLDRFYMAARAKMGLWQTEMREADGSILEQGCRRSSRRSVDRSADQDANLPKSALRSEHASLQQTDTDVRERRRSITAAESDRDCEVLSHHSLSGGDEDYLPNKHTAKRPRSASVDDRAIVRRSQRLTGSLDNVSTRPSTTRASARLRSRIHDVHEYNTAEAGEPCATADGYIAPPASAVSSSDVPAAPAPSPVDPEGIILIPQFVDSAPYPPRMANAVAKNKKRRQVGEEDISDEFYARMHRPMELIEKRSRNRELELLRYAEHLGKLRSEAPELFVGRAEK